jgi:hypothetical protein
MSPLFILNVGVMLQFPEASAMERAAVLIALAGAVLAGCEKKPPPHYVLCDDRDGNGWRLVDIERNPDGYLIACTYQSPDGRGRYTSRCGASSCG